MFRRPLLAAALLAPAAALAQTRRQARPPARPAALPGARNVVLVHGAFADGSSYAGVVQILQAAGMRCIAVQNPLTSLSDDVAATRRALALMDGPTVLVGHSYGGNVISEAGDDPKVVSLVFLAALAPEPGELFGELGKRFPAPPGLGALQAKDGFAALSQEGFVKYFMPDVPAPRARVLAAAQGPVVATLFDDKTTKAAWQSKPNFYAVSTQDQMIAPEMERFLAKRINATTVELSASHASLVSQPAAVAKLILAAASVHA